MRRETAAADVLVDRVLCHDVRDRRPARWSCAKGARIDDKAAADAALRCRGRRFICSPSTPATCTRRRPASGWRRRWSATASRSRATRAGSGRWRATRRGLLRIRREALTDVERARGHLGLHAVRAASRSSRARRSAKAKVTPLAIPEPTIAGRRDDRPRRPGARGGGRLPSRTRSASSRARASTPSSAPVSRRALKQKVDWFGSRLLPLRYAGAFVTRRRRRAAGAACARAPTMLDRGRGLARSIRSIRSSAGSRCWAPAWSATARPPIPAACSGSPAGTACPCSACRPAGCSRRRRPSISCCPRILAGEAHRQPRARRARPRRPALARDGLPLPAVPRQRRPRRARVSARARRPALYSDVIRERWRRPRFRGELPGATAVAEDVNPLCGDRVRMMLRVRDGLIDGRPLHRRLVRDLHGVGRRGRRADRGPRPRRGRAALTSERRARPCCRPRFARRGCAA